MARGLDVSSGSTRRNTTDILSLRSKKLQKAQSLDDRIKKLRLSALLKRFPRVLFTDETLHS